MTTSVTFDYFASVFENSDSYKTKYTRAGLVALFDYFEQYEEDTGEQIDFDYVSIACEYSEYTTAFEAAEDHGYEEVVDLEQYGSIDLVELGNLEEKQALEWLEDRTQVIQFDGGVIIANF